ncbi:NTP transferase domain-containing protein [Jannaschia sp. M317]|uniref:nucleotidyltransferase family protein n=1 Tax=Jannaschia sp. M317 TaxID=2867011 RepID=UPI0021A5EA0A|nr:nucleotidyltransferase family protein [Jannaschia sp. M317]UWQ16648.1 nucleotidyltransferase family protein [Jannaschia sp. M317]
MRQTPAILILAAGASSRMAGRDKLLEEIDGTPLILRATRAACAVSDEVLVALPAADRSRRAWLGDTPARLLDVQDLALSASIRAGAAACRSDALMIQLADLPGIGAEELDAVAQAWRTSTAPALRATAQDGTPGHPIVLHRELFPELQALTGDTGARDILARHKAELVALPGDRAVRDLDTPADWAKWHADRRT